VIEPFHDLHFKPEQIVAFPASFRFRAMNGEPDRRMILAGPFDAVFFARRNENVVALGQNLDFGFAFETQSGRSGQDHDPFGQG
jgi:hypothetical protein